MGLLRILLRCGWKMTRRMRDSCSFLGMRCDNAMLVRSAVSCVVRVVFVDTAHVLHKTR